MTTKVEVEVLLKRVLGANAAFYPGQWEAIEALVIQKQRALVVQRTGWGKSLVYFLSTRLLREQGAGLTILISPLLALIRNQIEAAAKWGVKAVSINSTNYGDHTEIEVQVLAGKVDLLLISPERLANERFQRDVWAKIKNQVGLLVVDEAHCISDWGHDFRPDFRRLMRILDELPTKTPVLGTTATANDRVVRDVSEILGAGLNILRGSLTRESLSLYVYPDPMDHAERLTLLSHLMRSIPGSGIIYCTTTRDCLNVAGWLQVEGFNVKPYYANVENETGEDRVALEQQLLNNELKALVASVALGMGFDKPDLHFVVHFQQPGNVIGYYQQIGRAGRGIDNAHIILMHGPGDADIQHHFIETAFPKPQQVEAAVKAFESKPHLSARDLQAHVNVRQSTLEKILTHLEVENIIVREDGDYKLNDAHQRPDYARWTRITEQRYHELEQMYAYINHTGCLMHFLAKALDDPTPLAPCGKCRNCRGSRSKFQPDPVQIERAQAYLRNAEPIVLDPRKQWVKGVAGHKTTKMDRVNERGIALCLYHASGWGELVRQGYESGHDYPDEMIDAAARLLIQHWKRVNFPPQWVTSVPSQRRSSQVYDLAMRLASRLALPYYGCVQQIKPHVPQSEMYNSHQQLSNLHQAFKVEGLVKAAPVLLVDDLADSKWTLTVIGDLLREAGSGAVHPFVLATMM